MSEFFNSRGIPLPRLMESKAFFVRVPISLVYETLLSELMTLHDRGSIDNALHADSITTKMLLMREFVAHAVANNVQWGGGAFQTWDGGRLAARWSDAEAVWLAMDNALRSREGEGVGQGYVLMLLSILEEIFDSVYDVQQFDAQTLTQDVSGEVAAATLVEAVDVVRQYAESLLDDKTGDMSPNDYIHRVTVLDATVADAIADAKYLSVCGIWRAAFIPLLNGQWEAFINALDEVDAEPRALRGILCQIPLNPPTPNDFIRGGRTDG